MAILLCGFTFYEAERELYPYAVVPWVPPPVQRCLQREASQLLLRHVECRKRWLEVCRCLDVVEACHRYLAGDGYPSVLQEPYDAKGEIVVGADNRVRVGGDDARGFLPAFLRR